MGRRSASTERVPQGFLLPATSPAERPLFPAASPILKRPWLHCTNAGGRRRVMNYQTTRPAGEVARSRSFNEGDYEIRVWPDPAFMVGRPNGPGR